MKNQVFLFVIALLVVTMQVSFAGVIIQDLKDRTYQINHYNPVGQTFTAEDPHIETIALYIEDMNPQIAADDHDLTVELYLGIGNGGTHIATQTIDDIADGHMGWLYFDFTAATLNVGNIYSIMLIDDTPRWGVDARNYGIDYEGGYAIFEGGIINSRDLAFMVTPIPEPAMLSLLAFGGLLIRKR